VLFIIIFGTLSFPSGFDKQHVLFFQAKNALYHKSVNFATTILLAIVFANRYHIAIANNPIQYYGASAA